MQDLQKTPRYFSLLSTLFENILFLLSWSLCFYSKKSPQNISFSLFFLNLFFFCVLSSCLLSMLILFLFLFFSMHFRFCSLHVSSPCVYWLSLMFLLYFFLKLFWISIIFLFFFKKKKKLLYSFVHPFLWNYFCSISFFVSLLFLCVFFSILCFQTR